MHYAGILIEVSDTEVHIKSPFQWISLLVSTVSDVKLKGSVVGSLERSSDWGTGE